ncbi:RNA-directed DNA polymerase, eukaryota [Tanacetum coccineum]
MDFILCNMQVTIDDVHVCVRIREIMGECEEVFLPEKQMASDSEDECSSNNDYSLGDNQLDEDDLFDDDSECNFTINYFEGDGELVNGGGGLKTITPLILMGLIRWVQAHFRLAHRKIKNLWWYLKVKETQFEVMSLSTKETLERDCLDKNEVDKDLASRDNRLLNIAKPSNNIDDEILNTMEVGCDIRPMNIASININGVGSAPKRKWVRSLCYVNNLHFIGIQESKSNRDDHSLIHSLWGNQSCSYAVKKADGNSGGIIAIWNVSMFCKYKVIVGYGFLAIFGDWVNSNIRCLMIVVYASQDLASKQVLWNTLSDMVLKFNGPTVVLGDFNEIYQWGEESSLALTSLPLRILESDHCPIILKTHHGDYEPYSFKFFNSWLLHDDLPSIVSQTWSLPSLHNTPAIGPASLGLFALLRPVTCCPHPSVKLKSKLQTLKNNVKAWQKSVLQKNTLSIRVLKAKVESIDIKSENGGLDGRDIMLFPNLDLMP